MSSWVELTSKDLTLNFPDIPEFLTTDDIQSYNSVIGQNRAVASIDLGLKMEKKEYNIYITGGSGTGKTGYIVRKIEEYAKNLPAPNDWCYVFNFEDSNKPIAISLETGKGSEFKKSIFEFINHLLKEVPVFFNSKTYDAEKNSIIEKYDKKILALSKEINDQATENGFSISQAPTGEFIFIPMKEDKKMSSEEYNELCQEEKDFLNQRLSSLKLFSIEVIKKMKELKKELEEELRELDDKIAENIISGSINSLKTRYGNNNKIVSYLTQLEKDIVKNIAAFKEPDDKQDIEARKLFFKRYEVNVLVSNNSSKGAPVIFADSNQYSHLFGDIQYENKMGNLTTDFTLLKPGCLHLANGGFLLIKAQQLFSNPICWEVLKKCINLETIFLEGSKSNLNLLPILTLEPENIPLKLKVLLIGSNMLYSFLLNNDPDFGKLFKIKAEFDHEIINDETNTANMMGFIANYVKENKLKPISRDGIINLLRYSTRLSQNKNYFSAEMSKLLKIVDMADYCAGIKSANITESKHVRNAIVENEAMHGLIQKKLLDMYRTKKYMVELKGTKVGQINGLSVVDYGDVVIGQQHKITAATFAGRKGIINIEREANLSGSIHSKGVLILSGFLGELIGQETPISFNASIVFEQMYSGIEGDSASAAELLALLSSLSDIPLKQSLAVTGSVNQKGEIQPIGGVNQKIEGFFDICSIQGLDKTHGVVMPFANLDDLVLDDRVVEAVDQGLFHIYAVKTIEDCLHVLFPKEFSLGKHGSLMPLVKQRILDKLRKYNKILSDRTIYLQR